LYITFGELCILRPRVDKLSLDNQYLEESLTTTNTTVTNLQTLHLELQDRIVENGLTNESLSLEIEMLKTNTEISNTQI
jgi:hypothetical protein